MDMFTILNYVLKYFNKILIAVSLVLIPSLLFIILLFYYKTKTNDMHIIILMTIATILYTNINILGFVIIKKLNFIKKKLE